MKTPQAHFKAIQRLLSAFPATNSSDPEQALRNYLDAVEDWHADDVDAAVTAYIKGQIPGFDGKWAPTAPMLVTGCRLAAEQRARTAYLDGLTRPRLQAPQIEQTPESRARIMAMAKQASEALNSVTAADNEQRQREKAASWKRTNERFAPDMSPEALAERLGLVQDHYWSVGDDGEAA